MTDGSDKGGFGRPPGSPQAGSGQPGTSGKAGPGDSSSGFGGGGFGSGFGAGSADSSHGDYHAPQTPASTEVMAIASFGVGLLSLLLCCCCGPLTWLPGIGAIVLGVLALRSINGSGGMKQGKGFAWAGIGTAAVAMLISAVMIILQLATGAFEGSSFKINGFDNLQDLQDLQGLGPQPGATTPNRSLSPLGTPEEQAPASGELEGLEGDSLAEPQGPQPGEPQATPATP